MIQSACKNPGRCVIGHPFNPPHLMPLVEVVLKPGAILTVDDRITHCRQALANYKIPRRVEFLDTDLPKSGTGKVMKRILRERFWAHEQRAVG